MDKLLLERYLDFTKRKKKWIVLFAAFGFTGFGFYKVYHCPSVARRRKRLFRFLGALVTITEAVSLSAETIGIVSKDMKQFIQSENDQIPNSLKQLSKVTMSEEFSESLCRLTQSLTVGILRGYRAEGSNEDVGIGGNSEFVDRVMDRLFSTAGSGFASVVVGSFARNLVMGFFYQENGQSSTGSSSGNSMNSMSLDGVSHRSLEGNEVPGWVNAFCDGKGKELLGNCIQLFVSTAVAVYLDKTMHINTYDEMFSGLTNRGHEDRVRDMLVSVCNGAVETLVKTSHQVFSSYDSNASSGSASREVLAISSSNANSSSTFHQVSISSETTTDSISNSILNLHEGQNITEKELSEQEAKSLELNSENSNNEVKGSGWISKVSSTLAVPSNRKFVLDVTGRVAFETVRSILDFSMEKLCYPLERFFHFGHEAVLDGSLAVVRYITVHFYVIATILLSIWLHIQDVGWISLPS